MVKTGLIIFLISLTVIAAQIAWLWRMDLGDENFFLVISVFAVAGFCLLGSAVMIVVGLVVNYTCPNIE